MKRARDVISGIAAALLLGALFVATTGAAFAQSAQKVSPKVVKEFHFDMHHNVGEPLPVGIKVIDAQGNPVDLRAVLHSFHAPVILLVVRRKHCPPCQMLLAYVRMHPDLNAHGKTARLVVLAVMDSGHAPLALPAKTTELHTRRWLDSGFLAHYHVPETFVFNRELTLIERRIGLTSPEATLSYPVAPSSSSGPAS